MINDDNSWKRNDDRLVEYLVREYEKLVVSNMRNQNIIIMISACTRAVTAFYTYAGDDHSGQTKKWRGKNSQSCVFP